MDAAAVPETRVRPAESPADYEMAAEALALAFCDDPCWGHLLRDERTRGERLLAYFNAELEALSPEFREVWVTEDGGGAAVWARPRRWRIPMGVTLREGAKLRKVFGRRLGLALRTAMLLERRHPNDRHHWYLHYLGVEPRRQGRGLGGALLAPVLHGCDSEGTPAYLEASTERNRRLYERNGFVLKEVFEMPGRGGPPVRGMWREAG